MTERWTYYGCTLAPAASQSAGAPRRLYAVTGRYPHQADAEPSLPTLAAAKAWVREQADAELARVLEQHGERPFRIYRG